MNNYGIYYIFFYSIRISQNVHEEKLVKRSYIMSITEKFYFNFQYF